MIITSFLFSCALVYVNPIIYERAFPVIACVMTGRHAVQRILGSEVL